MSNRFAPLVHARQKDVDQAVIVKKPKQVKESKENTKPTKNEDSRPKSAKPAQGNQSQPARPAVSTMQLLREKLEAPTTNVVEKAVVVVAPKKIPAEVPSEAVEPQTEEQNAQPVVVELPKVNVLTLEQFRKEQEANQIALKRQPRAPDTEGIKKLSTIASDNTEEFIHLKKKHEKEPARPVSAPVAGKQGKAPVNKSEPQKGKTTTVETKSANTSAVVSSNSTHKRAKGTVNNELLRVRFTDSNKPNNNNNRPRVPRNRAPQDAQAENKKDEEVSTTQETQQTSSVTQEHA